MNALHAFLIFWNWFTTTHTCQVFAPDSIGLGNHVVYGNECTQAFMYAMSSHLEVAWEGATQGIMNFGHIVNVPS